jgi:hypothetical protein
MIVSRLKLANLRAIEAAEFRFQPGMNLIVGVNGVGKTSVLDALGVCLSAVVKHVNQLRGQVQPLAVDDIRIGAEALTLDCTVRLSGREHNYVLHKPREASATSTCWARASAGKGSQRASSTATRARETGFSSGVPRIQPTVSRRGFATSPMVAFAQTTRISTGSSRKC